MVCGLTVRGMRAQHGHAVVVGHQEVVDCIADILVGAKGDFGPLQPHLLRAYNDQLVVVVVTA